MSQVVLEARVYPGFHSIKQLGVFTVLPVWDASPLRGYPPVFHQASMIICQYSLILLSEERHCENKVFLHERMTQLGLVPRPRDLASSSLSSGPLSLLSYLQKLLINPLTRKSD